VTPVELTGGYSERSIQAKLLGRDFILLQLLLAGGRGGHADFANFTSPLGEPSNLSRLNIAQDADGADAVLAIARNNFRMGASQLKVMQSGGVVSAFDPWQMEGRTLAELEAAVKVANQYGSYAMAHTYKKEAIIMTLNAGVKSIEHGFM
jgi:imidazolonepropionase-like amidohydrolase